MSNFCTELTGITQEQVDAGIPLSEALKLHEEWLVEHKLLSPCTGDTAELSSNEFVYLTCGDWDLKTCLPNQLSYHQRNGDNSMKVQGYMKNWLNIKREFQRYYGKKAGGMVGMLNLLELELQGRHHSGIDDSLNIARICSKMIQDGWIPQL